MADILIRGMEMPKNCLYCHFVSYDNDRCVVIDKDIPIYGTKPSWCPIVPLPKGHGRCIDADALLSVLDILKDKGCHGLVWDQMRDIVKNMVTIVPAEGGNIDGN